MAKRKRSDAKKSKASEAVPTELPTAPVHDIATKDVSFDPSIDLITIR
jgi:hypothetical protein